MSRVWLTSCSVLAPACIVLVFLLRAHLIAKERLYWRLAQGVQSSPSEHSMRILFVGNSFIHYNGGAEKAHLSHSAVVLPCSKAHLERNR